MRKRRGHLAAAGEYLQLLLPHFQPDFGVSDWRHDMMRAQRDLRREARLWLLPWTDGEVHRWSVEEHDGRLRREAAIPSDTFNVIDVVHATPRGFFYPREGPVPEG